MPRAGPGGVIDRGPGIIVARHRQALRDVVSDDRPTARPHVPALPPARVPTLLVPEPGGCHGAEGAGSDLVARPPAAATPRSPPVS
jgi:hypothetical protein